MIPLSLVCIQRTTRPALDAPHVAFGTVDHLQERQTLVVVVVSVVVVVVIVLLVLSSLVSIVNRKHARNALNEDVINVKDVEFVIVQARKRRQLVVEAGG